MDNLKSLVDIYVDFYSACLRDVASSAKIPSVELERDLAVVKRRAASEGLSFFTKTLPKLGKALDRALSTGERLQSPNFKKKKGTQLPAFLGTLFKRSFDSKACLRREAQPVELGRLRQLLLVLYKLKLPYDERTVQNTVDSFVAVNREVGFDPDLLDDTVLNTANAARALVRRVLCNLDLVNIIPRHGPGVVSTNQEQWEKKTFPRLIRKLEQKYPFTEYFCYNLSHVSDIVSELSDLEDVGYGQAKLVAVPKDSRGPRLISCEPLENQWIQQGQLLALVRHLESHRLTSGQVNFTSQAINRQLALESSSNGEFVTLDMKEASDRVSKDVVKYLFPETVFDHLDASRSESTVLPDGTEETLNMFAPMGSAVCFPVESLCFWAVSVAVVMCTHAVPLTKAARSVYVYGDDIIVRSEYQAAVQQTLPKFGFMLNEDKCCTADSFRESCGCDAFKGVDITPTRCSSVWSHWPDANTVASYVEYSNAFYARGYYRTSEYLERLVRDAVDVVDESRPWRNRIVPYTEVNDQSGVRFIRPGISSRTANKKLGIKYRKKRRYNAEALLAPHVATSSKEVSQIGWEEMLFRSSTAVDPLVVRQQAKDRLSPLPLDLDDNSLGQDGYPRSIEKWSRFKPRGESQVGIYAMRHRNRLKWRWTDGVE